MTKTVPGKFFQARVNDEFVSDLDELRKSEDDLPSRAEMLRRLIARAKGQMKRKK